MTNGEPPTGTSVEVVLFGVVAASLRFRTLRAALPADGHPDAAARALAGLDPDPAALLHSTSWRFEAGAVVLTYAALPDPSPWSGSAEVPARSAAVTEDPLMPSPARVEAGDVAAHACRHLAFLRYADPLVAACADAAPRPISVARRRRRVGGA